VTPNINSVDVHTQLSDNRHPVDGALVGVLVHRGHMYVYLNMAQQLVESPKVTGEEEHSGAKLGCGSVFSFQFCDVGQVAFIQKYI